MILRQKELQEEVFIMLYFWFLLSEENQLLGNYREFPEFIFKEEVEAMKDNYIKCIGL